MLSNIKSHPTNFVCPNISTPHHSNVLTAQQSSRTRTRIYKHDTHRHIVQEERTGSEWATEKNLIFFFFIFLFCFYYHHHHTHSAGTNLQRNSVSPADREKYRPPRSPLDMENDSKRRKEDKLTHVSKINFLPPQRERFSFLFFVCFVWICISPIWRKHCTMFFPLFSRDGCVFFFLVVLRLIYFTGGFYTFFFFRISIFTYVSGESKRRTKGIAPPFENLLFIELLLIFNDFKLESK